MQARNGRVWAKINIHRMLGVRAANDDLLIFELPDDPAALELVTNLDAHGGDVPAKDEGRKKIGKKAIMK